jgi:hypothetical protein
MGRADGRKSVRKCGGAISRLAVPASVPASVPAQVPAQVSTRIRPLPIVVRKCGGVGAGVVR